MPAPPLPAPNVAIVNPETGLVDQDWYDWFRSLTAGGGQLAFPATQNPSIDPNTLDDYEEGTWTPLATFATPGDTTFGGHILGSPVGHYTKIGNLVFYTFNYSVSPFTHSTASGHLRVTGLPFLSAAPFQMGVCSQEGINMALDPPNAQTQVVCMRRNVGDDRFLFSVSGIDNPAFINEVLAQHVNSGGNLVLFCSGCFIAQ